MRLCSSVPQSTVSSHFVNLAAMGEIKTYALVGHVNMLCSLALWYCLVSAMWTC